MKISLKTEYACRVMVRLAQLSTSEGLAHIDQLAEAEEVPANYLVQILNDLRNAGLIHSRRGKMGGYGLARKPSEVSLYDIVRAVDGDMFEPPAASKGASGPRVNEVWSRLLGQWAAQVREIGLDDLAVAGDSPMYFI